MVKLMIGLLKRVKNSIKYGVRYPGLIIASTARVSKDVRLSDKVIIGAFAGVGSSNLGQATTVHSYCVLTRVISDQNVSFYDHGSFTEVEMGSYSYVAARAEMSMTKVGRFCSIGPSLICGYGNHPVNWVSTSPVFFSTFKQCGTTFSYKCLYEERKPIVIGNDVWIGARVFIRDGISIGNGAIVAAGSVIVKDVPDYAIVGGVPAKIIRYRFPPDVIASLSSIAWWNWSEVKLKSAQNLFSQSDMNEFINWAKKHE